MRRSIYFDSQYGIETFALCVDGKLTEYRAEPAATGAVIGNIYKGRVTDVLNGMQAAFVDCGLERHCYISVADLCADRSRLEGGEIDIPSTLNLHEGDEILVQVTKAAQGKKGAKVTTNLSFVGKYLIYTPDTPFVGVSAKIADEELRKNLIFTAKKHLNEGEGIIMRTAAPYAVRTEKMSELEYFRKLYRGVVSHFKDAPVGELLYSDSPLYMRVLRDLMLTNGDEIHVGNEALYEHVKELSSTYPKSLQVKLIKHGSRRDMFYTEGLYEQFTASLQRRVELENGAYLVFDRTEALTVIDVNTGKFVGDDSLEHTVYSTNVLAAREIARQVKLRNLGGLFVVDFIDMTDEKHRQAISDELDKALREDKSKCKVQPMSKFGLIEFTRKRTGVAAADMFLKTCGCCNGAGFTRAHESLLAEFRARLLETLSDGASTVCADLNFELAAKLMSHEALKNNIASLYPQARIYIVFHRTYREDCMYFRKVDTPTFALPEGSTLLY